MNISLLITARCNASCGHCSTDCGPYRTESLSRDEICSVMDQAAALSEGHQPEFYLSGGEPFLDFALLLGVLRHGKKLNAVLTCVTNGYWATSAERAHAMLSAVKEAGLCEIAVSRSRFHEPFVSQKRVERVLEASRAIGLPCTLKNVRLNSDPETPETVAAWACNAGAAQTQELPLMPHLRTGVTVPDTEYTRKKGIPRGRCPSALLTVREDGEAYMCCTPGGFNRFLSLGNIRGDELSSISDRFYLGGAQQILRKHGPAHFAREARARGLGNRLRSSYSGICDLCTHITSDPVLAALADDVVRDFETQQLEDLFTPAIR